ncbi:sterol 3-beta-glucosyltransferase [Mycolicibacterium mageritense DSM 44476 = CIP 104973]|uniref:Erythromycin biosynthesis protein CIII-like C-terminal domain-containing protein n=1 Tax=Mycolicibacterium mageritense TaxID=53462 RepID=A0ABM7HXH7_MYCME|nr:glycosyltransferase [Mycolicibacterium mageritense]MCC9183368.1 glycosyltransferase [Mycolicibacterium mageritense]BBX35308.1 hypothetical protein MMAGJ_45900 [Mycolicibacterium mageritense]GJJ18625.1 hypothetical protein MTY414_22980 [Mycolicibacterium mageritense]CDO20182.1 glycosyltransferase [Mycolicibacterium mageritense DSM 44476 = CIP 104973]
MATIGIIAIGSHGDVAPLTGLGVRLQHAGHRVTMVAYQMFAELVIGCGLDFRPLADGGAALGDVSPLDAVKGLARFLSPSGMRALGSQVLAAVHDEPFDVLLLSPFAEPAGHPLAEALSIPSVGVRLQPLSATGDHPPSVLGAWSAGRRTNRAAARVGETVLDALYGKTINGFRAELELPNVPARSLRRQRTDARWPILYGYSPTVLPRPADWRPGIEVVGYWWPARPSGWQPSAELTAFLDAGPAPVVIGFGSTVNSRAAAEKISGVIRDAVQVAGARAVVQSGWAGLDVAGDDVLCVGEVPHDWLFTRAAVVVHHCGAGTTAAGLRAGVPAVAVPAMGDQPFWARRLAELGASPAPIPQRRLTSENLGAAIRAAMTDNGFRTNAARVSDHMQAEDGAGRVLKLVEELLA